jgi:hypothetical protein
MKKMYVKVWEGVDRGEGTIVMENYYGYHSVR